MESIARHSEGYMRDAISLLGQIISIGGKNITQEEADLVIPRSDINEIVNLIDILSKKDASSGIKLINKLVDEGIDLKNFLNDLIEILRKLMIVKINPNLSSRLALDLGENLEIKINEINANLTVEKLMSFIDYFANARNKIKDSFIIQLPLEMAVVELCLTSQSQFKENVAGNSHLTSGGNSSQNSENNTSKSGPRPKPKGNLNIDINVVREKWPEVLSKIKKHNHSLSFILRVCEPKEVNGDQVCVAFKYKFHKDRVDNPEIKRIIEKVLAEVYNGEIFLSAFVDEKIAAKEIEEKSKDLSEQNNNEKKSSNKIDNQVDNPAIDDLLKNFGGKIVS